MEISAAFICAHWIVCLPSGDLVERYVTDIPNDEKPKAFRPKYDFFAEIRSRRPLSRCLFSAINVLQSRAAKVLNAYSFGKIMHFLS